MDRSVQMSFAQRIERQVVTNSGNADIVSGGTRLACKRRRLSQTSGHRLNPVPESSALALAADISTSLEVDIMIVDYLAYQTIETCLSFRNTDNKGKILKAEESIAATDTFLHTFKARHASTWRTDAELRLRLQILQLVTLSKLRYTRNASTPALAVLDLWRRKNQVRAQNWIHTPDRLPSRAFDDASLKATFPMSRDDLQSNGAQTLHNLGLPAESDGRGADGKIHDAFYGSIHSVSLLDLLPLFMRTSAARKSLSNSHLEELWMELAGEFMLQACLEQYLTCGADGFDAIDQAFAWGYVPFTGSNGIAPVPNSYDDIFEHETNAMFEDNNYEGEIELWGEIKSHYFSKLVSALLAPDQATSPTQVQAAEQPNQPSGLVHLSALLPLDVFERKLTTFYEALACSISKPILLQLEQGYIDGMTSAETERFLHETCGIAFGDIDDLLRPN